MLIFTRIIAVRDSSCFQAKLLHPWIVTVSGANDANSHSKLLVWALVLSLMVHVTGYSVWKVGQKQGWWKEMAVPRWLQGVAKPLIPPELKVIPAIQPAPQTQLHFVEVDPALALDKPPPDPMFQ